MFCKNCGVHLNPNADICPNCGGPVGCGNNHCPNCGAITNGSAFCSECGVKLNDKNGNNFDKQYDANYNSGNINGSYTQNPNSPRYNEPGQSSYPSKPKSKLVAGLLALFVGCFGVHNFYLGNNNTGLIQILVSTIGGFFTCGIATFAMEVWAIIEAIFIFTGKINTDVNGIPLDD